MVMVGQQETILLDAAHAMTQHTTRPMKHVSG